MANLMRTSDAVLNTWNRRSLTYEALVLALAPLLTWVALRFVLINQDQNVDPWYYTGYGRIFPTLYAQFGWRYYAGRFPAIALNEAASLLPPVIGYAVLRYFLLLVSGVPLYVWARRSFGRGVALLSYLFLFWNPLLPRILLFDLTTFVSVPLALAGAAMWLGSDKPWARILAGVLFTASVVSHTFTATAIGIFVLIQVTWRIRHREIGRLVRSDVVGVGVGTIACLALGFMYYRARIGPFDVAAPVRATLWAISAGNAYAGSHSTPLLTWASREHYVYIPLLCVILGGVLLRRRLLDATTVSSVWWFAATYTGMYLVYQLVFGRFVLETFYYFAHLTVAVFLLLPVILFELASAVSSRVPVLAAAALALLSVPVANRLALTYGERISTFAYGSLPVVIILIAIGLLLAAGTPRLARLRFGAPTAAATFVLLIQVFTFLNPYHREVYDPRRSARETDVYLAALSMLDIFASYSRPDSPVMLWFCERNASLASIASSVQRLTLHQPWNYGPDSCESRLGEHERAQLQRWRSPYVMMLDEDGSSFRAREAALSDEGYVSRQIVSRRLGGTTYHTLAQLVRLDRVAISREARRVMAMPSILLAHWVGDDLRTVGTTHIYTGHAVETLARGNDGSWTFSPITDRDHFSTPYIPIPSTPLERSVAITVKPSPSAGANCILHVQNDKFENIGLVRCDGDHTDSTLPVVIGVPQSVPSIRMYAADAQRRPIVLPQEISVTLHTADPKRPVEAPRE
jgi:hypothetical protein